PGGLDVPVHGFATDGRREVRPHRPPEGQAIHVVGAPGRAELHAANLRKAEASSSSGARPSSPYEDDDYERLPFSAAGAVGGRCAGSPARSVTPCAAVRTPCRGSGPNAAEASDALRPAGPL